MCSEKMLQPVKGIIETFPPPLNIHYGCTGRMYFTNAKGERCVLTKEGKTVVLPKFCQ